MSQIKMYKTTTWALLLLNIAILAFFLSRKSKCRGHSSKSAFRAEVVEVLNLDRQQEARFRQLADAHGQSMKALRSRQQQLLPPYFKSIASATESVNKDSLLRQYQQLEREKLEVTTQHFQEIKSMLEEDQLPHFENLMSRFIDRFLLGGKKKARRSSSSD